MFCSELVIAAFQAAVVADQLARDAKLSAKHLSMPRAWRLHASNSSPLAMVGAMRSKDSKGQLSFEEEAAPVT